MTKNPISIFLFNFIAVILTAILVYTATYQVSAQESGQDFYFPLFTHYEQPLTSNSYYMITVDSTFLYDLGCELGARDQSTEGTQDSVAVLDFSYPICDADTGFGADLFGYGPVGLVDIQNAVKSFASGYYTCTGSDDDSNLVIGVGTNNKATSCDTEEKAAEHGAAWAEMINAINQWAVTEGIFQQVQAYGASDIEVGWNTPSWSRAWVDGYDVVNEYPLIHFGDAAGCPYLEDSTSTTCGAGWTMEDVWYVSWGSNTSLPLPLIYLTNGIHAQQWTHLSRYSVSQHGSSMEFTGVFTQWQACEQWGCNGTDNTPFDAYDQLFSELAKYPSTAQELDWKTDIRWILSSEVSRSVVSSDEKTNESQTLSIQDEIEQLQTTLHEAGLSLQMQISLEEKLTIFEEMSQKTVISQQNAALKASPSSSSLSASSDPPFITGIRPGGIIAGLPYGVTISNTWQTVTENGYLQIAAGTTAEDPSRGALYALLTSFDKLESQAALILAPDNGGSLTIIEDLQSDLLVESENGTTYILDLATFSLNSKNN